MATSGHKSAQAECIREGTIYATKASGVAAVISTAATLGAVRYIPWVTKNINYTGRALIVSAATVATFFITSEQTILECGRKHYDDPVA